jgi:hypothetical protein
MLRFIDRNHAPSVPKSFTFSNGPSVPWESKVRTFDQFVGIVQAFATANGLSVPSAETIEDHVCQRLLVDGGLDRFASSVQPSLANRKVSAKAV